MNPRARYQDPLTIDDVLASPMEATPLHKLDCCLVTDGAGAVVLTSAERARTLRKPPALVLGAGTCHTHSMISQMPDLTVTGAAVSGAEAFGQAGLTPADVDVVQLYDSFTITVLLALEDLGFCPKGEGGAFVADGPLAPGGSLPGQDHGGGLSYTHPGQFGMFLLVEAVRQLRGECGPRQVDGRGGRARPRQRRCPVGHVHGHPRNGGDGMSEPSGERTMETCALLIGASSAAKSGEDGRDPRVHR